MREALCPSATMLRPDAQHLSTTVSQKLVPFPFLTSPGDGGSDLAGIASSPLESWPFLV